MIEHALSAHHNITHGAGLAIINPAWMRFAAKKNTAKFVQFAERVFGLKGNGKNDLDCALEGIGRYEAFLKEIGCPTRLSEVEIGDELFEQYAADSMLVATDGQGHLLGRPLMTKEDIVEVLRSAL
jgi:alcohol dehydrogenase YqhD (iron-dependent ADH family)